MTPRPRHSRRLRYVIPICAAALVIGLPTASYAGDGAASTDTSVSDSSDVIEPTSDTGAATDDTSKAAETTKDSIATTSTTTSIDSPTSDEYTSNEPPVVTGGGPPTEVASTESTPVEGGGTPEVLAEAAKPQVVVGGGLPFTGLGIAMIVALGSALVAFGALMQLQARRAAKHARK